MGWEGLNIQALNCVIQSKTRWWSWTSACAPSLYPNSHPGLCEAPFPSACTPFRKTMLKGLDSFLGPFVRGVSCVFLGWGMEGGLWVRTEFGRQGEQGGFCIYPCSQRILLSWSLTAMWQRFLPFCTSDLPRSKDSYFFTNALIEFKGLVMFCNGTNATSMAFIERDYYWLDQINMANKCADLLQLVKQNSLRIQFKHSFSFFFPPNHIPCVYNWDFLTTQETAGNSLGSGPVVSGRSWKRSRGSAGAAQLSNAREQAGTAEPLTQPAGPWKCQNCASVL